MMLSLLLPISSLVCQKIACPVGMKRYKLMSVDFDIVSVGVFDGSSNVDNIEAAKEN